MGRYRNRGKTGECEKDQLRAGLMLDFSLEELAIAARLILSREDERANLDDIVSSPRYTIRQKIQVIASYFRMRNQAAFNELFPKNAARLEIVVTFLALLELIKRRIVFVQQDQLFGNIEIEATGPWDENLTFELEFGE